MSDFAKKVTLDRRNGYLRLEENEIGSSIAPKRSAKR